LTTCPYTSVICDRGGEREVQFLFADAERLLPVWRNGRLEILRWGNRRGESLHLPCTAWTQLETVEGDGWSGHLVEPVVIPATMGLDKGVWFCISQGIRGLLAHDERGVPLVYVICEPSSHYYRIMTRGSDWMPVLIGERTRRGLVVGMIDRGRRRTTRAPTTGFFNPSPERLAYRGCGYFFTTKSWSISASPSWSLPLVVSMTRAVPLGVTQSR
jgi:hypothetical protein